MHPNVVDILEWFSYEHLPPELQLVSKPLCETAGIMASLGEGPELIAGLRKLLEAKDCFVRAKIYKAKNS